jgi:hypothetical protein
VKERLTAVLDERLSEFCRECGVLWLVFSLLDRLVANTITLSWVGWNVCGSLVVYAIGIYIEVRKTS